MDSSTTNLPFNLPVAPQRRLPHSTEAEQAVLGAMMQSAQACALAKEQLTTAHFFHAQHQLMFEAALSLMERAIAVDGATLTAHLHDYGRLEEIGGAPYVLGVLESVVSLSNTEHYIGLVLDKAMARKVIDRAQALIEQGYNPDLTVDDLLDVAKQQFTSLEMSAKNADFSRIDDLLSAYIKNLELLSQQQGEITGLHTGFDALDSKTSGLQKNDLIIVAARPAMGKTAFALNLAQNVAMLNKANVAIFSLEMGAEQLVGRLISAEGRIDSHKLRSGMLSADDWRSLKVAVDALSETSIFVDDTPGIRIGQLRAKCRALHQQHPLNMVVIDYLQLMQGSSGGNNRQLEISEISRSLKELARELQIPVIALSQLSRQVESREDKRPMMSDLRESGSIEQDADIVMFLLRQDYYRKPEEPKDNMVEVIFGKHRNGATGSLKLGFKGEHARFENIVYVPDAQG